MFRRPLTSALLALFLAALIPHPARADSVIVGAQIDDGIVNGIRNGKLSLTPKAGAEKFFELSDVTAISLDQWPKFLEAERLRGDPLQTVAAAAAYKALIAALNKPELKFLAEWRAIEPTDRDNRWTQAVTLFLDVYQGYPTESMWKFRPTHWPAATSKMLPDSADKVAAAVKTIRTDEARKNLRSFLLEIYTRAGDTTAAQRLAREISTGLVEDPHASATQNAALGALDAALSAGNWAAVVQQADALLATATGEAAVQVFALKARALEGQGDLESAAAAWLRIPAHYPASPGVPAALLRAAELEQKLNHPQAAAALTDELRAQYTDSKEAATLKQP